MTPKKRREMIANLADGRFAYQIAEIVGCRVKYVHKILNRPEYRHLPRPPRHAPRGERNPAWIGGRVIQRCGRVLVPAPTNHPNARIYGNKKIGRILEHRIAMEKMLGRFLDKKEVVDHIDGCVLNNDLSNLRLFASNGEHLRATLTGVRHDIHSIGRMALSRENRRKKDRIFWNRYQEMWRLGDYRLLQILHAQLLLDKESPFLLGTHRYLDQRQIDWKNRGALKDALMNLCQKWELYRKLSELEHLL